MGHTVDTSLRYTILTGTDILITFSYVNMLIIPREAVKTMGVKVRTIMATKEIKNTVNTSPALIDSTEYWKNLSGWSNRYILIELDESFLGMYHT